MAQEEQVSATVDRQKVEVLNDAVRVVPEEHFFKYGGGWINEISTALALIHRSA